MISWIGIFVLSIDLFHIPGTEPGAQKVLNIVAWNECMNTLVLIIVLIFVLYFLHTEVGNGLLWTKNFSFSELASLISTDIKERSQPRHMYSHVLNFSRVVSLRYLSTFGILL